jgi:hypothetical protein
MLAQPLRKSLTVVFVLADLTNTGGVNKARAPGLQGTLAVAPFPLFGIGDSSISIRPTLPALILPALS